MRTGKRRPLLTSTSSMRAFLEFSEQADRRFRQDWLLCLGQPSRMMPLPSPLPHARSLESHSTRQGFLSAYLKAMEFLQEKQQEQYSSFVGEEGKLAARLSNADHIVMLAEGSSKSPRRQQAPGREERRVKGKGTALGSAREGCGPLLCLLWQQNLQANVVQAHKHGRLVHC